MLVNGVYESMAMKIYPSSIVSVLGSSIVSILGLIRAQCVY